MKTLKFDTLFGLLVLLLFCAATLTLPACSTFPAGGNASLLAGSFKSTWGNQEPQAEFRAEQTIWQLAACLGWTTHGSRFPAFC